MNVDLDHRHCLWFLTIKDALLLERTLAMAFIPLLYFISLYHIIHLDYCFTSGWQSITWEVLTGC